jgi:hypothetical protein
MERKEENNFLSRKKGERKRTSDDRKEAITTERM